MITTLSLEEDSSVKAELWVISFIGKDRPGLIRDILMEPAKNSVNIVDLDQSVMQGIFVMSVVADFSSASLTPRELESYFEKSGPLLGIESSFLSMEMYRGRRRTKKNLHVVTIITKDRVGIVRDVAALAAENNINIERASVTARGELISIEFLMDFEDCNVDIGHCKSELKSACEKLGLDVVIQSLQASQKEKRLIVFDMDMTIVDFEIINKLASFAGVDKEVRSITERAMQGEMDFEQSLRQRVHLLKGMPISALEMISMNLQLTPGSEDLIHHLKQVGYKIALISGGFTYFTDVLKEKLGFDYAFANQLEIKEGILTGEICGDVIDAQAKGRIVNRLADLERISPENIVAVGDGANDCLMIQNAGLGVAFNAKDVLKKVSDGSISRENLKGLLNILGLADKEKDLL
jgi:phosphoserine phosphatase